jgi:hypothetical protein
LADCYVFYLIALCSTGGFRKKKREVDTETKRRKKERKNFIHSLYGIE